MSPHSCLSVGTKSYKLRFRTPVWSDDWTISTVTCSTTLSFGEFLFWSHKQSKDGWEKLKDRDRDSHWDILSRVLQPNEQLLASLQPLSGRWLDRDVWIFITAEFLLLASEKILIKKKTVKGASAYCVHHVLAPCIIFLLTLPQSMLATIWSSWVLTNPHGAHRSWRLRCSSA